MTQFVTKQAIRDWVTSAALTAAVSELTTQEESGRCVKKIELLTSDQELGHIYDVASRTGSCTATVFVDVEVIDKPNQQEPATIHTSTLHRCAPLMVTLNRDSHGYSAVPLLREKAKRLLTRFEETSDELKVLVKHWVNQAIEDEYFIFWGQCVSSSDFRRINRDWKRVNEIATVLGEDATEAAAEEALLNASQNYDRNHWIVFRYGDSEEQSAYQNEGGQALDGFEDNVANNLASKVVERVFREGSTEQQMRLLKEELKRYSVMLNRLKSEPHHIVKIFEIDFPIEVKRLVLAAGVEDPHSGSEHNTFFNTVTLEQGKAVLSALELIAARGEDALEELVADLGQSMKSAGLDRLTPRLSKNVRFSILPFKAALVCDSSAVLVPVVHYLNADPEGCYLKSPDGALPPVEWKIKYLTLSKAGLEQIHAATDGGATPFECDFVMFSDGLIRRINKRARWKVTPELLAQIEKAAKEASTVFEAKLSTKHGVTIANDLLVVDPNHSNAVDAHSPRNQTHGSGPQVRTGQDSLEAANRNNAA